MKEDLIKEITFRLSLISYGRSKGGNDDELRRICETYLNDLKLIVSDRLLAEWIDARYDQLLLIVVPNKKAKFVIKCHEFCNKYLK